MENDKTNKSILIADDKEYFRTVLSDILSHFGYKTEAVINGEKAITALDKNNYSFNLGIIDLHTPIVTGIEIITEIRKRKTIDEFPIIAITSVFKRKEDVRELLRLKVNQFIYKCTPFEDILYLANKLIFPYRSEKRDQERVLLALPVFLKSKSKEYRAVISNLSTSGAFVKINSLLRPKSEIDVSFSLNGALSKINCKGLVIHKHETDLAPHFDASKGFGIHFLNLKNKERDKIKEFISHIKRESFRI